MTVWELRADAWSARRLADELRTSAAAVVEARPAAESVTALVGGDLWAGEAFEAFRRGVEAVPLLPALDRAREALGEAAAALDAYALRLGDRQERLRWLWRRHAELEVAGPDPAPEALAAAQAAARRIEAEAEQVHEAHRVDLRGIEDLLDRLRGATTFATPPPSGWDRVSGALGATWRGAGRVVAGAWEGTVELATGLVDVVGLLRPANLEAAWRNRGRIVDVLRAIAADPDGFLLEVGRAMIDLETLREDPARWFGRRIPDLLFAVATGGVGRAGTTMAQVVRRVPGGAVRRLVGGGAGRVARTPAEAVAGLVAGRRTSPAHAVASIGADAGRLTGAGTAPFRRSDTLLGRVAGRVDALPGGAAARSVPGLLRAELTDGLRGATVAGLRRTGAPDRLVELATRPSVERHLQAALTGGLTTRLARLDELVAGAPALADPALAVRVGAEALAVLDEVDGRVDAAATVVDVAERRTGSAPVSAGASQP